jgi:hypothetical protein
MARLAFALSMLDVATHEGDPSRRHWKREARRAARRMNAFYLRRREEW